MAKAEHHRVRRASRRLRSSAPAVMRRNAAALGHRMRFVAVTNGGARPHQTEGGGGLAARRRAEARGRGQPPRHRLRRARQPRAASCCRRSPSASRSFDQIRLWNADLVLAPRPNDSSPTIRHASSTAGRRHDRRLVQRRPTRRRCARTPVFMCSSRMDSEAQPFQSGRRGIDRRSDRQEDRRPRLARVADV